MAAIGFWLYSIDVASQAAASQSVRESWFGSALRLDGSQTDHGQGHLFLLHILLLLHQIFLVYLLRRLTDRNYHQRLYKIFHLPNELYLVC